MATAKLKSNKKRSTRKKKHPFFSKPHKKTAWLIGGVGIVVLYIWIFYYFFVGPTGFRWRALYSDPKYPNGYEIHGIDNFENARNYGYIRGAYHFWSIHSSARDQAYHFLKKVHLKEGDLPPVLDVEHKPANLSVEEFQTDILTWLHIVEDKYHVKPIIYTYYKFKQQYLSKPVFDDYPYWIAHYYVDKVEYKGAWKFWQHTDAGQLPGIKGYIDFNIYNGSFYDLKKLTIQK